MILEDLPSINAALATMNPMARNATQVLARSILEQPSLLRDREGIKKQAFYSCAHAFMNAGLDVEIHHDRFATFIEDHGANVLDLAVSMVLFLDRAADRAAKRKQMWGTIGKVAAVAGAAALGAFFS